MHISETLKVDIEDYALQLRSTNQLFKRAQSGELTPGVIATYIANLHILVKHTDPNLELAQNRAMELGKTSLAQFFEQKRREEEGHDRWAERDLAALSEMFGSAPIAKPATSIVALLAYLRGIIATEPMHYLAYILFVEYVTVLVGPEWLRMVEERCGIPVSVMTVVGNHIELDRTHVVEGLREIDRLVGDQEPHEPLLGVLRTSMQFFEGFCSEVAFAN